MLVLTLISILCLAEATELDSFTGRDNSLPESSVELDAEVNRRIGKAIYRANLSKECSTDLLALLLSRELRAGVTGGFMISPMEAYSNRSSDVVRQRTPKDESIFSDVTVMQSIPIAVYPLGKLLNVGGHYIAGDKFSHFFNEGWFYHQKHHEEGQLLLEVLEYGSATEKGRWGLATSGVYSYADLVANFHGMRFWYSVRSLPDPLTGTVDPFVECEGSEWVQRRLFKWTDWVDAGWDEGVNCSYYTKRLATAVSLVALEQCPVSATACAELRHKYAPIDEMLISPECR